MSTFTVVAVGIGATAFGLMLYGLGWIDGRDSMRKDLRRMK